MGNVRFFLVSILLFTANPADVQAKPGHPRVHAPVLKDLNVRYMLRGYCHARTSIPDLHAAGGFGRSDNAARALAERVSLPADSVVLHVVTDSQVPFADTYRGMRLLLINNTAQPQRFSASDSRLSIVQQALDPQGEWADIEYLPQSWCGNSRHTVSLQPQEGWEFSAPRYVGTFLTRLRFRLDPGQGKPPIYSNEFAGSINLEQFSVQQGHTPQGIMDPYNN